MEGSFAHFFKRKHLEHRHSDVYYLNIGDRFVFKTNGRISSITSYKDHWCSFFYELSNKATQMLTFTNLQKTPNFRHTVTHHRYTLYPIFHNIMICHDMNCINPRFQMISCIGLEMAKLFFWQGKFEKMKISGITYFEKNNWKTDWISWKIHDRPCLSPTCPNPLM